jgi:hypothetical protein
MALVYPDEPGLPASDWKNKNTNVTFEDNYENVNAGFMCRGTNFKLNSTDPAYQYQTQKIIQNTVRVPSSLYTSDLGALNVYQRPTLKIGVNWNQMSDRAVPHYQSNSGNSQGSFYHGSSIKHTQTRCRPGAGTPGGAGVDIKHNSYYRYMDRLKAKKDIRRGVIPPTFGLPIPFNPGFPVYGGKTVKTAIVSGCGCPDLQPRTLRDDAIIYRTHFDPNMFTPNTVYTVGQYVYARVSNTTPVLQAKIIAIDASKTIYTIQFTNDSSIINVNSTQIIPYFPCNCSNNTSGDFSSSDGTGYIVNGKVVELCYLLNALTGPNYLVNIAQSVIPSI